MRDMPPESGFFRYKVLPGRGMWILTRLMPHLALSRAKPDAFFSPSHYLPLLAPMPMICSIMDLGYLEFSGQFTKKDYWQLKLWTAISIFVSKAVIAISNSTKADIVRRYPFGSGKTFVTHLGYDRVKFHPDIPKEDVRRFRAKYSIVGDYILYLGTLKPSKNLESLLEAFQKILRYKDTKILEKKDKLSIQYPVSSIQLVVAGKKGWLYEPIFNKVKELGLSGDVIFTDYVAEADKPALIAGSKVFVLPSFWEGFGLDALSAMACGVPVVVSKVGALPEVVGDAGILVDPYSTDSITEGIRSGVTMNKLDYNKQVAKGLRQASGFSWEKAAKETLEIIENVKR